MGEWISTKDRLPKKAGQYWIVNRIGNDGVIYDIAAFGKVGKEMAFYSEYPGGNFRFHRHVDAWMPIEPYKELKDKTDTKEKETRFKK